MCEVSPRIRVFIALAATAATDVIAASLFHVSLGVRAVVTGCPKLTCLEVTGCSGPFALDGMLQTPAPTAAATASGGCATAGLMGPPSKLFDQANSGSSSSRAEDDALCSKEGCKCLNSSHSSSSSSSATSSSTSSSTIAGLPCNKATSSHANNSSTQPGSSSNTLGTSYTSHRWKLQELQLCSGPCTATSQQVLQLLGFDFDRFDHTNKFDQHVDSRLMCISDSMVIAGSVKHKGNSSSSKVHPPTQQQQQQQGLGPSPQNPKPHLGCHLQVLSLVGLRGVCDVLLLTLAKLGCSKLQHLRLEECYRPASSSGSSSSSSAVVPLPIVAPAAAAAGGGASSSSCPMPWNTHSSSSSRCSWCPSFSPSALLQLIQSAPQLCSLRLRHATAPLPADFVMAVAAAAPLIQVRAGEAGSGV